MANTIKYNKYDDMIKILTKNVTDLIINYTPELYVHYCKISLKRVREQLNKLNADVHVKRQKVNHYKKEIRNWCEHRRVQRERYWDGHRGHTSYNCLDCNTENIRVGKKSEVVTHIST